MSQQPVTYEQWIEQYRPIKNHLGNGNDAYDGCLFETCGDELDWVKAQPENTVWTLLDVDGAMVIGNGFHYVNRMGYFVTEVPFEGEFLDIDLDD